MTVFKFALLRSLRNPVSLVLNSVIPVLLMFIPVLWEANLFGGAPGFPVLAFIIIFGAFTMSKNIIADKEDGAITRILMGPVSMRSYLAQNLLSSTIPLLVSLMLTVLLGIILRDWSFITALGVFITFGMLTATCVTMAYAWQALFKDSESSTTGFSILATVMAMLGGLFIPTSLFPGILEHIGVIFPSYWAMHSLGYLMENGEIAGRFWVGIGAMALFAMAFLLYGSKRRVV
ncbi:MAG: ABC transporter permease [Defluviitaleaceae bacterium]|nr:ABC transporter permease [Defluviitaleaceae bacterium]